MHMDIEDVSANLEKKTDTLRKAVSMKMTNEVDASVKTDAATAQSFPITILNNNFLSKVILDGINTSKPTTNSLQGQTVKGKIDVEGKMSLDTIGAVNEVKSILSGLIEGMPEQLKFPDKQLKVGDTFTRKSDEIDMNMLGISTDKAYPVIVTYKLIEVKDNLAYFDTKSEFNMNINKEVQGKMIKINGKGSGSGKMVFNIIKGYPQSTISNVDSIIEMDMPNTKATVKFSKNKDAQYVVISN